MSYKAISRKKGEKENDIIVRSDAETNFLRTLQSIQWNLYQQQ
jgi:hypothetical protein